MKTTLLLIAVGILVLVSSAQAQRAEKPRKYEFAHHDAPSSQEEAIATAEVIVRVRIQESIRTDMPLAGLRRHGLEHRATVLEVLKGADGIDASRSIRIQQAAGSFDDGDALIEVKGDAPLAHRGEYVLFLTKAGDAYRENYGPFSRLELTTHGTRARGPLDKLYTGATTDATMAKLRAAVR